MKLEPMILVTNSEEERVEDDLGAELPAELRETQPCGCNEEPHTCEDERDLEIAELRQRVTDLEHERMTCGGSCDIPLASRQVGPDGHVPGNARECAEMWEREAARLWAERTALAAKLEEVTRERDEALAWRRCADALADEVDVLVRRKVLDMRSPAADALLDYREPPSSPRSCRLAEMESDLAAAIARAEQAERAVRTRPAHAKLTAGRLDHLRSIAAAGNWPGAPERRQVLVHPDELTALIDGQVENVIELVRVAIAGECSCSESGCVHDQVRVEHDRAVAELRKDDTSRLAELERIRPIYELACRLQDADQCEDHSTGDDCEQGSVEHELFEELSIVRDQDEGRFDPIERGQKKRGPAVASEKEHILNDVDECVSWCDACRENRSRGLNPDGTAKAGAA